MRIALVGNPNVGKTALLNALTGGSFEVGNFPGTTVERKEGKARIDGREVILVDLPGIYSLEAYSLDEKVAREYIIEERPDLILNVINASNLERNLYLTLQLAEFRIPMIVVLNMIDEALKRGLSVDARKLEEILGVPVVETVAVERKGIEELKRRIVEGGRVPKIRPKDVFDRVRLAERIAKEVVREKRVGGEISDVLDEVFMDEHLGIPIFLSLMWMTFTLTYTVARPLTDVIDDAFTFLSNSVGGLLGGIIKGVGSVLVFVPNIVLLFLSLSILELSGYMPRAVYLLDGIMSKFGLNGRSSIPLLMGFGCNVPAVLVTRGIEDDRIRIATIVSIPFTSCSARLPIYILLASIFFPKWGSVVIMCLYIIGLLVALLTSLSLRKTVLKGEAEYIMELPPYRIPNLKDVWNLTWNRTKHFLQKAGTVILGMSVVIWFLTHYPTPNLDRSFAGTLGKAVQPVFSHLGWNWQLVLSILMGAIAKEVVVETLKMLGFPLSTLHPADALAFMVFVLLYMPCMATIAVIRGEAGWKWTIFAVIYSFLVAYFLAFVAEVVARSILPSP